MRFPLRRHHKLSSQLAVDGLLGCWVVGLWTWVSVGDGGLDTKSDSELDSESRGIRIDWLALVQIRILGGCFWMHMHEWSCGQVFNVID